MITTDFSTFINQNKPIYEAHSNLGESVKVILSKWHVDLQLGSGEFYESRSPNKQHFNFTCGNNNHIECYDTEASCLDLRISDDFESLTIIHRISKNVFGTLKLSK